MGRVGLEETVGERDQLRIGIVVMLAVRERWSVAVATQARGLRMSRVVRKRVLVLPVLVVGGSYEGEEGGADLGEADDNWVP